MNNIKYNDDNGVFIGVIALFFITAIFILAPYAICGFNFYKIKQLEARIERNEAEIKTLRQETEEIVVTKMAEREEEFMRGTKEYVRDYVENALSTWHTSD